MSFFQAIQTTKICFTIFQNEKTFLQPIKKEVLKVEKLRFFQKVMPWFWSKNGHFSMSFFQAIQARKMRFIIFQNEKTPFQAVKTRSSKRRKIEIFPKALTHGFGRIMAIFQTIFREYRPEKCVIRYCRTKKRLSTP